MLSWYTPVLMCYCSQCVDTLLLEDGNGGTYSVAVSRAVSCNTFCYRWWCYHIKTCVIYSDTRLTVRCVHTDPLVCHTIRGSCEEVTESSVVRLNTITTYWVGPYK